MRFVSALALCAQFILLAGCASNDRFYGNIYEGLKTREMNVNPQIDRNLAEKQMPYQQYEAERQELLENDEKK